jgi:hypothetical protein
MFERICVPPMEPESTRFDLGILAESLIFYQQVYLILGVASLNGLLQQLGPDLLLELIADHHIHIFYKGPILGAVTAGRGTPFPLYDVGIISSKEHDLEIVARDAFTSITGKNGRGRRLATRFCRHVHLIDYPEEITRSITGEMQEGDYLQEYIRRRLASDASPVVLKGLDQLKYRFALIPGRGYKLDSNLNLAELRAAGIKTAELEDPGSVLAHYATTVGDMSLWAKLQSEAALTPRQADILTTRVDNMLGRKSDERLSAFQDFVFDDARAVREAINTGARQFRELLPVFAKARKFSQWLSNQAPEVDLIRAYHKEVTADTWIDKLSGKTARWSFFLGAGLGIAALGGAGIGTAAGIGLSVLDFFFLDRIVKGWKPHHFVEKSLRPLLEDPRKT